MRYDTNYNDIYVNQVQLPPSESQIFQDFSQPLGEPQLLQIIIENRQPSTNSHPDLGELPTYNEAILSPNIEPTSGPPPSYDSLYGRVIGTRHQSKGFLDFLKNVFVLLLGTIGCTIILCITVVIPICMIVIGSTFFYQCPQAEFIPVYLLVGGIMGIIKPLLSFSRHVRQSGNHEDNSQASPSGSQTLINWIALCWFFIGSYWIYRIYEPNYDPSRGLYCNKFLYTFSFWLVSSVHIVVAIIILSVLLISVLSVTLHKQILRSNGSNV